MKTEFQRLDRFTMSSSFRGRSPIVVQLWWIIQSTLFAMSPQVMFGWRSFLLRLFGAKIGKGVRIRSSVTITYPWKLTVGDYVWVGDETVLYSLGEIEIGSNTALAHRVYICTGTHDYTKVNFDIESHKVVIGEQVWLPNDVYVAPGVTIGRGTVIAARSSVFSDMPGGMVCVGSPAKPIKERIME